MEYSGDGLYTVEVSPLRLPFTFQPNDILVHPTFIPRKGDLCTRTSCSSTRHRRVRCEGTAWAPLRFAIRCNGERVELEGTDLFLRQSVARPPDTGHSTRLCIVNEADTPAFGHVKLVHVPGHSCNAGNRDFRPPCSSGSNK